MHQHPSSRLIWSAACAATLVLSARIAQADQLAYWDFNNSSAAPTSFNSNFAAVPTLGTTGGASQGFGSADASSDPVFTGLGYTASAFPAQGTNNKTAGYQFSFNTSNMTLSNFTFDWRTSNTGARHLTWQYTLNGSSWTDGALFTSGGGDTWNNGLTLNLSSISGASNNANFGIRLVSTFSPDGFTQTTSPNQTFGPDAGYRTAAINDRAYASSGTWRLDAVSLNGTYNDVAFTPANLVWNTSSGAWDTNGSNKPWLNGAIAAPFAQAGGKGDRVTFNNPTANSIVTINAAGVTPNSTTVNNSATLTLTGGAIAGTGGLTKSGAGRLIIASTNSFTSANSASSITAGVVETRANNGLGGGTVSIGNATWDSTTTHQTANNLVNLTGPVTFQTTTDLTVVNGLAGSGALTKTGGGTLGVGGTGTNSGSISITAGSLRMETMGAIGGIEVNGVAGPTVALDNAVLVLNSTGNNNLGLAVRLSDNITLNNAGLTRTQLTPTLGPAPTNGDSELSSYLGESIVGGTVTVSGTSTISNLETRTASASDPAGGGGSNNAIVVRMPMLVTAGSTLNLFAANGTLSTVSGVPTGNVGNTSVSLRAPDTAINSNDSLTLQAGATLAMTGAGDKRIGSSNQGKPIVARGTSASETTIKADGRTYMTAHAADGNVNTIFVVAGSGTGGLRVEAPMNANYSGVIPTSGFFGNNPDTSETTLGNIYTIMAPQRFAGLASGGPSVGVDGAPITRGGTLTVAAIDAAGATGTIDNGPSTGSAIRLGLDNTAASGALVYQIDPTVAVTGANVANWGGLVLRKTGANSVTTKLMANTTLNGTSPASTTHTHLGGTLDLNAKVYTVGSAALQTGTITNSAVGAGTVSTASITKSTAGTFTVGPKTRLSTANLTASGGTLRFDQNGSAVHTSKVTALTINGGAVVDMTDNDLIIGGGTTKAQAYTYLANGYDFGNFGGANGISTSLGANTGNTTLGILDANEYADNNGSPTFDGYTVNPGDLLIKYTYFGDVDFSGQIDASDYNLIDFGFVNGLSGWANGDADYSGGVDASDYNVIDFAFASQAGTALRAMSYLEGYDPSQNGMGDPSLQKVVEHYAEFGEDYRTGFLSHVPEPTSLAAVALAAGTLMGRRRRRA